VYPPLIIIFIIIKHCCILFLSLDTITKILALENHHNKRAKDLSVSLQSFTFIFDHLSFSKYLCGISRVKFVFLGFFSPKKLGFLFFDLIIIAKTLFIHIKDREETTKLLRK